MTCVQYKANIPQRIKTELDRLQRALGFKTRPAFLAHVAYVINRDTERGKV